MTSTHDLINYAANIDPLYMTYEFSGSLGTWKENYMYDYQKIIKYNEKNNPYLHFQHYKQL